MSTQARTTMESNGQSVPSLPGDWNTILQPAGRPALEEALLRYVTPRRWFRAKNRHARRARLVDLLPLTADGGDVLAVVDVDFDSGEPERYLVPLASQSSAAPGHAVIAQLKSGALVDGLAVGSAAQAFRTLIEASAIRPGQAGVLLGRAEPALAAAAVQAGTAPPRVAPLEQTNSTVSFGERMLLKIYRQLTPGINPELEMGTFLDAHAVAGSRPTPPVLGALLYQTHDGTTYGVGIMHAFVASDGDAWSAVERELRDVLGGAGLAPGDAGLGRFVTRAATLGRRTAEIHLALASAAAGDQAFAPEPLTRDDRRAAADRAAAMLDEHLSALTARRSSLSADARAAAERLAEPDGPARRAIATVFSRFVAEDPGVVKTRIHGDLHLGQVLARGDDFTIIDFEGEPARPLAERRGKSSPLRDVMGMVRSFSYAPEAVLRSGDPAQRPRALPLGRRWEARVTEEYRRGYLTAAANAPFLPRDPDQLRLLLNFYALERVIYEVGYELANRTDWVDIPLAGLLALVEDQQR